MEDAWQPVRSSPVASPARRRWGHGSPPPAGPTVHVTVSPGGSGADGWGGSRSRSCSPGSPNMFRLSPDLALPAGLPAAAAGASMDGFSDVFSDSAGDDDSDNLVSFLADLKNKYGLSEVPPPLPGAAGGSPVRQPSPGPPRQVQNVSVRVSVRQGSAGGAADSCSTPLDVVGARHPARGTPTQQSSSLQGQHPRWSVPPDTDWMVDADPPPAPALASVVRNPVFEPSASSSLSSAQWAAPARESPRWQQQPGQGAVPQQQWQQPQQLGAVQQGQQAPPPGAAQQQWQQAEQFGVQHQQHQQHQHQHQPMGLPAVFQQQQQQHGYPLVEPRQETHQHLQVQFQGQPGAQPIMQQSVQPLPPQPMMQQQAMQKPQYQTVQAPALPLMPVQQQAHFQTNQPQLQPQPAQMPSTQVHPGGQQGIQQQRLAHQQSMSAQQAQHGAAVQGAARQHSMHTQNLQLPAEQQRVEQHLYDQRGVQVQPPMRQQSIHAQPGQSLVQQRSTQAQPAVRQQSVQSQVLQPLMQQMDAPQSPARQVSMQPQVLQPLMQQIHEPQSPARQHSMHAQHVQSLIQQRSMQAQPPVRQQSVQVQALQSLLRQQSMQTDSVQSPGRQPSILGQAGQSPVRQPSILGSPARQPSTSSQLQQSPARQPSMLVQPGQHVMRQPSMQLPAAQPAGRQPSMAQQALEQLMRSASAGRLSRQQSVPQLAQQHSMQQQVMPEPPPHTAQDPRLQQAAPQPQGMPQHMGEEQLQHAQQPMAPEQQQWPTQQAQQQEDSAAQWMQSEQQPGQQGQQPVQPEAFQPASLGQQTSQQEQGQPMADQLPPVPAQLPGLQDQGQQQEEGLARMSTQDSRLQAEYAALEALMQQVADQQQQTFGGYADVPGEEAEGEHLQPGGDEQAAALGMDATEQAGGAEWSIPADGMVAPGQGRGLPWGSLHTLLVQRGFPGILPDSMDPPQADYTNFWPQGSVLFEALHSLLEDQARCMDHIRRLTDTVQAAARREAAIVAGFTSAAKRREAEVAKWKRLALNNQLAARDAQLASRQSGKVGAEATTEARQLEGLVSQQEHQLRSKDAELERLRDMLRAQQERDERRAAADRDALERVKRAHAASKAADTPSGAAAALKAAARELKPLDICRVYEAERANLAEQAAVAAADAAVARAALERAQEAMHAAGLPCERFDEIEGQARTAARAAAAAEEHASQLTEETSMLRLELAARPTQAQYESLKRQSDIMERQLAKAQAEREAEGEDKPGSSSTNKRPKQKQLNTRDMIQRDRNLQRLGLQSVEGVPKPVLVEVVQDVCTLLECRQPLELCTAIKSVQDLAALVPRMERFIGDVCGAVFHKGLAHVPEALRQDNPSDVPAILGTWIAELGELLEVRGVLRALLRQLGSRVSLSPADSPPAVSEVVPLVASLVELERKVYHSREVIDAAETALAAQPDVLINRICLQFQRLFDCKSLEGALPAMNKLYLAHKEAQTFLASLRTALGLAASATLEACANRLEQLLEDKRDSLATMLPARELHAAAPVLPPGGAAVVVEVHRRGRGDSGKGKEGGLQQAAQVAVERMAARRNWPQVEIYVPAGADAGEGQGGP